MATLAEIIDRHRDEIMDRWDAEAHKAASARGLSQPELRSVLPLCLSALGGGESASEQLRQHLENHLAGRIRKGFDLPEIVAEFLLLEQCFNAVCASMPQGDRPKEADRQPLSASVQRSIALVTELFHEHMQLNEQREKRYLRLLQNVADEALRAPEAPLASRLKELLQLVMEAMGAQAASLLLYELETERLLTAASAGLAEEELERFATSLEPSSLGGKIAARDEPTALDDVVATELKVSESLHHSGIRSLLGARLPPQRKLFGALYIGLREERRFTARELSLLEALGDRLTLHLDNAKLYAELRQHIEDLGLERDLRERFVAILAHDLRGPLSVAKMSTQMLVRHPERLDQRRDLAVRIERNLDRIDRMIRDLLDVSRVRAGQRLPLRLDACDLGVVAEEVVEELSATHSNRFELVVPEAVRGLWSNEELRRALWNLGMNAVKYGAPDRPITIQVERAPGGARVSVHNFGKPIAPEDQARLFDLYSRLKAAARPGSGWGLGLALVRACAEAHGGKIEVRSSQEAGTTFTIDLPADSRPFQQSTGNETARAGASDDRSDNARTR
jgi:signal transduction histidine kinase